MAIFIDHADCHWRILQFKVSVIRRNAARSSFSANHGCQCVHDVMLLYCCVLLLYKVMAQVNVVLFFSILQYIYTFFYKNQVYKNSEPRIYVNRES